MSNDPVRSKPFIRAFRFPDILELAHTMREEDVDEIYHSSRSSPLQVLQRCPRTDTHTIEWNGKVVAVFGVVPVQGGGSPWMLGTDDLSRCKSLLRECRRVLDGYLAKYGYLTNACWSKNVVHINWIKWLGFTFEGSDIRNGETFLHFHRRTYV